MRSVAMRPNKHKTNTRKRGANVDWLCDMDDEGKALEDEREDWIKGNVAVQDLTEGDEPIEGVRILIEEVRTALKLAC
jgi:hypothetical protein